MEAWVRAERREQTFVLFQKPMVGESALDGLAEPLQCPVVLADVRETRRDDGTGEPVLARQSLDGIRRDYVQHALTAAFEGGGIEPAEGRVVGIVARRDRAEQLQGRPLPSRLEGAVTQDSGSLALASAA